MCAVPVQHGAEQRLHHAQGIHAGLLAILVGRPQVRHCAVRRLELCEVQGEFKHETGYNSAQSKNNTMEAMCCNTTATSSSKPRRVGSFVVEETIYNGSNSTCAREQSWTEIPPLHRAVQ
jgi:hypothetical protein